MLTQERVKELFDYDPETGVLIWIKKSAPQANSVKIGMVAGFISKISGYRTICYNHKTYQASRIIFLYMTGKFPENCIDHINGIKTDNRWVNLRDVTVTENDRNKRINKNNTSGTTGVYFRKARNTWFAAICHESKLITIKSFKNKEDAIKARKKAEVMYGYHKNHGRI